jgi:hypothetical protein
MNSSFLVNVTETNDIEFRDDIYNIEVLPTQDQDLSFFMRTKFRRVIQKKANDQDEYGAGGFDNTMLSSKFSDTVNHKAMGDPSSSNMVGGSPY